VNERIMSPRHAVLSFLAGAALLARRGEMADIHLAELMTVLATRGCWPISGAWS
jgi:hypothetical protein